jgi:hypothetical protein
MKVKMFTIYDSKAEAYNNPFYHTTRGTAVRALVAQIEKDEQLRQHGADYTVFEIGEWDAIKGTVTEYPAKINLGTALELSSKAPDVLPAKKDSVMKGLVSGLTQ